MLLINPPSPYLIDDKVFPNLGLCKVAKSVGGEVLDLAGVTDIEAEMEKSELDSMVGISATTPQMPQAIRIAEAVRRQRPDAEIVLGGPHVALSWVGGDRAEKARQSMLERFDAVVAGDGEVAIHRVVHGERGLIRADRRQDAGFLKQGSATDRSVIDVESYHYDLEGHKATSLIAQLGCPFACGFCGGRDSHAFRVIRKRDWQSVVDEVEGLYRDYGYTGFMFQDDELNINTQIVELMDGLSDLQDRLGVDFAFRGFIKAELWTDQQAAAMRRAGFRWILSGFEAAHPRILRNIRKRATVDDNERVIEIGDRNDIKVKALMSIGHPGESLDTVLAINRWLLKVRPADFDLTIITPYPGSPYYDHSVEMIDRSWRYEIDGDALYSDQVDYETVSDFYKGMPGDYVSHVWTDYLTAEDIVKLRDAVEYDARTRLGLEGPRVEHEHSMGMS